MLPAALAAPLAVGFLAFFAWSAYRPLMIAAASCARWLVKRLAPETMPFRAALSVAVMPCWGLILLACYVLVAAVLGLPLRGLVAGGPTWTALPRGFLLGAAEVSFSMVLATVAYRLLAPLRGAQSGGDPAFEYQTLDQSGWMRTYREAFDRLPAPLAWLIVAFPLLGEELIFRATAIPLLLPLGVIPAVAISTVLFAAVQAYGIPSWYQALGPISGALVMGVGHGYIFAQEGKLLPLLVAHLTFLVFLMVPRESGKCRGGAARGRTVVPESREVRLSQEAQTAREA